METVDSLAEEELVASPLLMKLYLVLLAPGTSFQSRAHLLRPGLSPRELTARLSGQGSLGSTKVTIPEGWSRWRIGARLEALEVCSAHDFDAAVGVVGEDGSAEGFLFPATYELPLDSDPREVVSRFVDEFDRRWSQLRSELSPDADLAELGFGRREVVTLASIIEKESGRSSERPRIARVFLNRLLEPKAGTAGRLQSDPTASYGCRADPLGPPSCRNFEGKVTPELLRDSKNLYNTYRHAGLPPGPISNPGVESMRAVLSPAAGEELYFVANGRGGHTFSVRYEDHLAAVKRLRATSEAP